jgi:hypothetical protein
MAIAFGLIAVAAPHIGAAWREASRMQRFPGKSDDRPRGTDVLIWQRIGIYFALAMPFILFTSFIHLGAHIDPKSDAAYWARHQKACGQIITM